MALGHINGLMKLLCVFEGKRCSTVDPNLILNSKNTVYIQMYPRTQNHAFLKIESQLLSCKRGFVSSTAQFSLSYVPALLSLTE